jgi:hypothetical protein
LSFASKWIELEKLVRFRRPKAACFLSYVEYGSDTNTSNIMKNRSRQGEVTNERGRVNKEVMEVNMVDVLSIQE